MLIYSGAVKYLEKINVSDDGITNILNEEGDDIGNVETLNFYNTPDEGLPRPKPVEHNYISRREKKKIPRGVDEKIFVIHSQLDMNGGRAIVLHIVMIYDVRQMEELLKMTSAQYFRSYRFLLRENSQSLAAYEIELMAGKMYPEQTVAIQGSKQLIGCIVFANIIDRDVPAENQFTAPIASNEVIRKVIVNNTNPAELVIRREGIFMSKRSAH